MLAVSFSLRFSPWWLTLALAAAAAASYWSYRRTTPMLPQGRRLLLGGLRFGALFIVIALLFEPVLRQSVTQERPPAIALLLDNSQSLSVRDSSETNPVASRIRQTVQALGKDSDTWRPFLFGGDALPLSTDASPGDSLDFTTPRTDIAHALTRARKSLAHDNLRGLVLISDGQYNAGRNPLYLADRYPVPIYTMIAGDTTRRRDLRIRRATTNEIVYKDTEVPVQARLQTQGFTGRRVTVGLYDGSRRLDVQSATVPEKSGEVPIALRFTPTDVGLRQYEVRVTKLDGEVTHRNNHKSLTVRVLDDRKKVVLLGAAPGPDVSATRKILERLESVSVEAHIQRKSGSYYGGPLPENLSKADALVLAGWPGSAARATAQKRVAQAAKEGAPLLFLLTRQTDLKALQTNFANVLPAAPENARSEFTDALLRPSSTGLRHPIFNVPGVPVSIYGQLPPLRYNTSRWKKAPDASVLATPQVRGVDLDDPMLLTQSRSERRTAAFLAAGRWRWANLPADLQRAESLWPKLLANLMQWVTSPDANRQVRVEPTRKTFSGNEPVELTGQVYDESLNPVTNAGVQVTVTAPSGKEYPYTMTAKGNGQYGLEIGSLPPGAYQYQALATQDKQTLGTDQGQFAVGALTLEFQETRADAALMRQLAHRSGGASFSLQDTDSLLHDLRRSKLLAPTQRTSIQETPLWHIYWMLAIVLILLAAEWFFRKRSGLV